MPTVSHRSDRSARHHPIKTKAAPTSTASTAIIHTKKAIGRRIGGNSSRISVSQTWTAASTANAIASRRASRAI
jgi:hypothetical protein